MLSQPQRRNIWGGASLLAVEVEVPHTMAHGRECTDWFAAFLTFDDDGRIIDDPTFMRTRSFRPKKA